MTSSVRTSFASLSTTCAFAALLALGACGGGDDGGVTVVDAAVDAAIDAPTDAPPLVCNSPTMNCGGECVNTTNDEMYCGSCTNMCPAGQVCSSSTCACPTTTNGVPAMVNAPTPNGFGFAIQPTLQINTSSINGNALLIGVDPTMTMTGMAYTLSEKTLGQMPTVGFAINFQFLGMDFSVDASFAATEGTVTFTTICPDTSGGGMSLPNGGVIGTLSNVKFRAVDGLLSGTPEIVPDGCTLPATGTYETITFTIGTTTCDAAAQ